MTPLQPELLAAWLQRRLEEGDRAAPPPEGLDPEVVEAIDALRPDLAPVPDIDLDALLDALIDGPLAGAIPPEEQAAAAALRDTLARGPLSADEAAALDDDAFATLAALDPERLPVPALDLDDLFGAAPAQEGPAGSPLPSRANAPTEVARPAGMPPSVAPAAPIQPPANRRRWLMPVAGAVAMAATVLLVIGPQSNEALQQPSPFDDASPALEAPTTTAAPAPPLEADLEAEPSDDKAAEGPASVALRGDANAGPVPPPPGAPPAAQRQEELAEDLASLGYLDTPVGGLVGGVEGARGAGASVDDLGAGRAAGAKRDGRPADATVAKSAPAASPAPGVPAAPDPAPERRNQATLADAEDADADDAFGAGDLADRRDAGLRTRQAPAGAATPSPPASRRAPEVEPEADPVEESEREEFAFHAEAPASPQSTGAVTGADQADEAVVTESVSRSRPTRRPRKRKDAAGAPRADAPMPAAEPEEAQVAGGAAAPAADLAALRAQAWGVRLPRRPTGLPAPLQALVEADRAAEAAGDVPARLRLLQQLLRSEGPPALRQDAAFRLSRLQAGIGRTDLALSTLARGLEVAGGAASRRAVLYAQQGEILELRGDLAGAAESYRRAAALRP